MKNLIFIICLLILTSVSYSQTASEIDSLFLKQTIISQEIEAKKVELKKLQEDTHKLIENQKYEDIINSEEISMYVVAKSDGKLREKPDAAASEICVLSKGDILKVVYYNKGYWSAFKDNHFGYLSAVYFYETTETNKLKQHFIDIENKILAEKRENLKKKREKEIAKLNKQRRDELIKIYGEETANKLLDGYIWIGMSKNMARVSAGKPQRINKSVGSWGVSEQWVYYDMYLYFDNGKLSSYQIEE
jgi:hypothetical protein